MSGDGPGGAAVWGDGRRTTVVVVPEAQRPDPRTGGDRGGGGEASGGTGGGGGGGNGGGGGSGGGEPLSKAEFATKGNAICAAANKKADALETGLPPSFDPTSSSATDEQLDKFGDYIDEIVDIFRDQVGDLRELTPPEEFQDGYDRALELVDESLNEGAEAAEAAHDGEREKMNAKLEESQRNSDEADKLAKSYGLDTCAD